MSREADDDNAEDEGSYPEAELGTPGLLGRDMRRRQLLRRHDLGWLRHCWLLSLSDARMRVNQRENE